MQTSSPILDFWLWKYQKLTPPQPNIAIRLATAYKLPLAQLDSIRFLVRSNEAKYTLRFIGLVDGMKKPLAHLDSIRFLASSDEAKYTVGFIGLVAGMKKTSKLVLSKIILFLFFSFFLSIVNS